MKATRPVASGGGIRTAFVEEVPSFYAFAESNPNPILITDTEDKICYVNAAWERLTGYAADEVCGRNPHVLRSDKTSSDTYKAMRDSLAQSKSFESEDFIDRKKDGTEFLVSAAFFPIKVRGKVAYYAQEMHDISARRKIEKQKDAFISTASHELRSPLSVITSSLELLRLELGDVPQAVEDIFRTLRSETGRFASLLSDLLDVSRMQSDTLRIRKEERDLRQLVHRVVDEARPSYTTHSLVVEEQYDGPAITLYDEARIEEVLTNLISNAVKYSPGANRVVVHLVTGPGQFLVRVQDFGIGIDASEQQKIFDMFYRAKNRGRIRGTGLGLYISARIMAAHGGELGVVSEPGKGSIFHFSLPLKPEGVHP